MTKKSYAIVIIILILMLGIILYLLFKNHTTPTEASNTSDYTFNLDSKNKYEIVTDYKFITMQNDGGSHTDIYYQIDLDNSIISKVEESYHANLSGTPTTDKTIIYTKKVNANIKNEAKLLLEKLITDEDINDSNNYNFFTIRSLNVEKYIYNKETIKNIKNFLNQIDELED